MAQQHVKVTSRVRSQLLPTNLLDSTFSEYFEAVMDYHIGSSIVGPES